MCEGSHYSVICVIVEYTGILFIGFKSVLQTNRRHRGSFAQNWRHSHLFHGNFMQVQEINFSLKKKTSRVTVLYHSIPVLILKNVID